MGRAGGWGDSGSPRTLLVGQEGMGWHRGPQCTCTLRCWGGSVGQRAAAGPLAPQHASRRHPLPHWGISAYLNNSACTSVHVHRPSNHGQTRREVFAPLCGSSPRHCLWPGDAEEGTQPWPGAWWGFSIPTGAEPAERPAQEEEQGQRGCRSGIHAGAG